jgi:hypothetical protein
LHAYGLQRTQADGTLNQKIRRNKSRNLAAVRHNNPRVIGGLALFGTIIRRSGWLSDS